MRPARPSSTRTAPTSALAGVQARAAPRPSPLSTFLRRLDGALDRLYRLCGYIAALCMVAIGVLVTTSIVTRLTGLYVPGLTEYSGYAMAAGSFFALAYTFVEGGHIRVELVLGRLPPRARRAAEIWCLGVAVAVSIFLAWYMTRLTWFSWQFREYSEGADAILLYKPQLAAMTGAIVLAIAMIHHFVKCLARRDYAPR